MGHFPLVLTAAVFVVVFVPQYLVQYRRQYRAVARAKETTGTVSRATVEEYPDGSLVFTRRTPSIAFDCEWEDRPQQSNNTCPPTGDLFPDRHYGRRSKAEAVADHYEPGSEAAV